MVCVVVDSVAASTGALPMVRLLSAAAVVGLGFIRRLATPSGPVRNPIAVRIRNCSVLKELPLSVWDAATSIETGSVMGAKRNQIGRVAMSANTRAVPMGVDQKLPSVVAAAEGFA